MEQRERLRLRILYVGTSRAEIWTIHRYNESWYSWNESRQESQIGSVLKNTSMTGGEPMDDSPGQMQVQVLLAGWTIGLMTFTPKPIADWLQCPMMFLSHDNIGLGPNPDPRTFIDMYNFMGVPDSNKEFFIIAAILSIITSGRPTYQ